ncbi:hypothetical protein BDV93DRAFT_260165 [Ceratobasidium sp. AG-I]|nr:hypothetical protein BDV93DRAFT_260165 [Ceratobasidium sp. AG-I]
MFTHYSPRRPTATLEKDDHVDFGQNQPESSVATEQKIRGSMLADLDQHGDELGKNAPVWETYMKETDRWDGELVDGWNKSLDVILIFVRLNWRSQAGEFK